MNNRRREVQRTVILFHLKDVIKEDIAVRCTLVEYIFPLFYKYKRCAAPLNNQIQIFYLKTLRFSAIFLSGSLRLNLLQKIQPPLQL